MASMRPENSRCSSTLRETTAATLTGGAGGAPEGAAAMASPPREQPASERMAADTSVSAKVENMREVGRKFMPEVLFGNLFALIGITRMLRCFKDCIGRQNLYKVAFCRLTVRD